MSGTPCGKQANKCPRDIGNKLANNLVFIAIIINLREACGYNKCWIGCEYTADASVDYILFESEIISVTMYQLVIFGFLFAY